MLFFNGKINLTKSIYLYKKLSMIWKAIFNKKNQIKNNISLFCMLSKKKMITLRKPFKDL